MLVNLADLTHNYFKTTQFTPAGIGFLAGYSKLKLKGQVDIRLFKSVNKLLDAVDSEKPFSINLAVDNTIAQFLIDFVETNPNLNHMALSQMLPLQAGRFVMKPINYMHV